MSESIIALQNSEFLFIVSSSKLTTLRHNNYYVLPHRQVWRVYCTQIQLKSEQRFWIRSDAWHQLFDDQVELESSNFDFKLGDWWSAPRTSYLLLFLLVLVSLISTRPYDLSLYWIPSMRTFWLLITFNSYAIWRRGSVSDYLLYVITN